MRNLLLIVLLLATQTISAQRKPANVKAKAAADKSANATPTAADLISCYRFEEASSLLEREINAARKKGESTLLLEADLETASRGEQMLQATEQVVFIDSLVVNKSKLLSSLRLTRNAGRIVPATQLYSPAAQDGSTETGAVGYINEIGDRAFLSVTDSMGALRLCTTVNAGGRWNAPQWLPCTGCEDDELQDYPFLMPDGMTLYYAAINDECLGGYDIFVTRYSPDAHAYLRPEHLGMPFNSPANDYLYAIDEQSGVGLFVTDRRQAADSVCIYWFISSDTRETYPAETYEDDPDFVRRMAMINAIAESQTDPEQLLNARAAWAEALQNNAGDTEKSLRIVINDQTIYRSLKDFRSATARRIAEQWMRQREQLDTQAQELDNMRREYAKSRKASTAQKIADAEASVAQLQKSVRLLEKNMRQAELQK